MTWETTCPSLSLANFRQKLTLTNINRRHLLITGTALAVNLFTNITPTGNTCHAQSLELPARLQDIKALNFDVFGTVVDWSSSIIREG